MNGQVRTMSRADAVAMGAFVIAGAAIAAWTVWHTVVRIIELAGGIDVPVLVEFMGTPVEASLSNSTVAVALDSGIVTVPQLNSGAMAYGVIGQAFFAVTVVTIVFCLIALSRELQIGRVFGTRSTVLVMTAGITGLVGFTASDFFASLLSNSVMFQMVDGPLDIAVMTVEPFTFLLAAFAIAIIGSVFVVGARLQRETEGLV